MKQHAGRMALEDAVQDLLALQRENKSTDEILLSEEELEQLRDYIDAMMELEKEEEFKSWFTEQVSQVPQTALCCQVIDVVYVYGKAIRSEEANVRRARELYKDNREGESV